jgi:spermidine synthase
MTEHDPIESAKLGAKQHFLPLLLVLFAGSGCAALIYEIVWFQLLQLVIGSSAVSLGVLLGTFMGGMCLGSILLPRFVSPRVSPLCIYALIELGIGTIGLAVLFGMPTIDRLYAEAAGSGLRGILLRAAVCVICLLPPTMLMGATLPAIARWVQATPRGVSWLGLFYGGNIAGAVFGCLLAGFYLLRVYDMAVATYVAASINSAVALLSLLLDRLTRSLSAKPFAPTSGERNWGEGAAVLPIENPLSFDPSSPSIGERGGSETDSIPRNTPASWPIYVTIALSGAGALAAEVIWTRLLSLMLGATVYTFSIILAVFLVGLGIGSGVGAALARSSQRPRLLLGSCQLLLAGAIAWTAAVLALSLPYWPIDPSRTKSPWHLFQLDLVRCTYAILPAACLWGASFPLALAAGARRGQDAGKLVGGMYAANTVGAIVGAIGASFFLIRLLGTQDAQRVLIGLSSAAALVALVPDLWAMFRAAAQDFSPVKSTVRIGSALAGPVVIVGAVIFLVDKVPALPWELVAFGRQLPTRDKQWELIYVGEGMNASVAVTKYAGAFLNFHVSGKVEASSDPEDMRLQRMLGHIPALVHPRPRSVLIVGCGAGVTAGTFVVHPEIEKIVICEIEPLVPQAIAPHFKKENHDVVNDPRVEIVYDDARHYVLTTPHTFDIITSDPIHPWVKGSATLYTKEYFEACKRRLNPGGFVTQWVPLYETDVQVVASEFATFFDVFPNGTVWSNNLNGLGFDIVLLGQVEELKIDADAIQDRLHAPDHAAAARSLEEVSFNTIVGLLSTYAGQARELLPHLADAEINRDRNLRLQYLAGMQLNTDINRRKDILDIIMSYRRYPEEIFTGSGPYSQGLRWALERSISAFPAAGGQEPILVP